MNTRKREAYLSVRCLSAVPRISPSVAPESEEPYCAMASFSSATSSALIETCTLRAFLSNWITRASTFSPTAKRSARWSERSRASSDRLMKVVKSVPAIFTSMPAPGQHPLLNKRIRLAAGAPLMRRPGTAMLYSNFGYLLLGDIVRRVSAVPFWQFVQSRLFEPLGMRDSYFVLPPELRERRVYRAPGMPATEPAAIHRGIDSPEYHELGFASGSAASTARNLAAFLQMLLNRGSYGGRQILSRASIAAMTRHQVDVSIPRITPVLPDGK